MCKFPSAPFFHFKSFFVELVVIFRCFVTGIVISERCVLRLFLWNAIRNGP